MQLKEKNIENRKKVYEHKKTQIFTGYLEPCESNLTHKVKSFFVVRTLLRILI